MEQSKIKQYRQNQYVKKRQRALSGFCYYCGKKRENPDRKSCNACLRKGREQAQRWSDKMATENRCRHCGKPATVRQKYRLCKQCWFKAIAKNRTGTVKNGTKLDALFYQQKCRCAYTGKELKIGVNASLDHIIPTSKGGGNNIDNLQWVDKQINVMKNDLTHDEFIQTISRIISLVKPSGGNVEDVVSCVA